MVTLMEPCGWVVADCDACSVEVTDEHKAIAVDLLWRATYQRFGPCTITVRPCSDPSVVCGRCASACTSCGCRQLSEIVLPGPIHAITEVWVDGEVVDPTAYRVDDFAWLVRTEGGQWPRCGNLAAEPEEAGSFVITYELGLAPPPGAAETAAEVACELAQAYCNDKSCRLPKRIRQKTRQGVTVTFDDLAAGRFGIEVVDLWVDMINARRRRSRVYSPDLPTVRETTWTTDSGSSSP
jgi:hypothetical protein